ncbi:MAG TPA: transposase [Candidatus Acidoferrales bacterium]|nr:transposase [Candidatus Acidoferrales bacterium]
MECNPAGKAVWNVWRELPERFPAIELDAFVVMPNHVHGILFLCSPETPGAASSAPTKVAANAPALGLILRAFKSLTAAAVNRILHRTGSVWQRNYYEHIVRSAKDLDAVRLYIAQNPMQWLNDRENPEARPHLS